MKKIKNALLIILVIVFIIPAFQGCKKGENDPFISLLSRKARLTGEWNLTKADLSETNNGTTQTHIYDGTNWTNTYGSAPSIQQGSEEATFDKDGTYKITIITVYSTYTDTDTDEGNWTFGRRNTESDYKNKECIILETTKTTSTGGGTNTYEGANCPINVKVIDELKNKELIVKIEGSYANGSTSTQEGTKTYEKK
jgi:hypothetical protein